MTAKRVLGLALDAVLWVTVGFVLLGANGPVRRYWDGWREEARTRRLVRAEWSQLASGLSRIDTSGDNRAPGLPVVIEFADFECPYCATAVDTVNLFLRRHPEASVVFRHFPLTSMHGAAEGAARAAVCAEDQGRFREIHSWLFQHHDDWKTNQDWLTAARAVGVPEINTFAHCLGDPRTSERVERDLALGRKLGVLGTPTFVSQRGLHAGAITVRELEKMTGF